MSARIEQIVALIEQYSNGTATVTDNSESLTDMPMHEITQLTKQFIQQLETTPNDDVLRAKSWATLNELVFRVTGTYPKLADQLSLLSAEVGMIAGSETLHLLKRHVGIGDGRSNDKSIVLAILRCMCHPTKTLTVVDENWRPEDSQLTFNRIYQRNLEDATPILHALDISPEEISHRFNCIRPNETDPLTDTEDSDDEQNPTPNY